MTETPPEPATMPPGGSEYSTEEIQCDRCGAPATKNYEGREFLNLCDGCFRSFGGWLARG